VNPTLVLRNHVAPCLIEDAQAHRIEAFAEGFQRVQTPFDPQHEAHAWSQVPPPWAKALCVSCSS
jgi:uncharacterized protein YdiU (UPF0061 family)